MPNTKPTSKKEAPRTLIRQPTPSIYALLNHENSDIEKIPISPTFLTFKEPSIEKKYLESLYYNSNRAPSNEFKTNLKIFSLFYTLYFLSTLVFTITLYISQVIEAPAMLLKIILLGFTSTILYIIIYLLLKSSFIYRNSLKIITIFAFYLTVHLIITDFRILALLTKSSISQDSQTLFLLLAFSLLLKNLMFNTFRVFLFLSIWVVILFTSAQSIHPENNSKLLYEVSLLSATLAVLCINCYRYEHTSKDVFWRCEFKANSVASIEDLDIYNNEELLNTEVEVLIQICERVKKTLKTVNSMVIYKDIKTKLKVASNELDTLKRRIAGEVFRSSVKLDNLDDQDRTFISQMFMQFSFKSSAGIKKFPTIKEIPVNPTEFFYSSDLNQVLSAVGEDWNFDIWLIYQTTGHSIYVISQYIFHKWSLCEEFFIESLFFERFFQLLEKKYHQNPYHNACHAADVLHSFLFFCSKSDLFTHLATLETLSCILACLGHDVGHPALTNRFLVQNSDEMAIQYNDSSVLENMHAFTLFSLLLTPGCNILSNLAKEDWQKVRKIVIELIIDTDMSRHFEILGRFRARISNLTDFSLEVFDNKLVVLGMGVKCADLGHSAKVEELHEKWTALICEEFFRQGDMEKERKQEISMYCDRFNSDIPKSQSGFIKNICLPMYESWAGYLKSESIKKSCVEQMKSNLERWVKKGKKEGE